MDVLISRIYENDKFQGHRVLVDRLWPRGVSKEKAALDDWWKDLAPSDDLRKWFNHDPNKWTLFREKYLNELTEKRNIAKDYLTEVNGNLILLYGAKDKEHTHALILKEYLDNLLSGNDSIRCSSPPCYLE